MSFSADVSFSSSLKLFFLFDVTLHLAFLSLHAEGTSVKAHRLTFNPQRRSNLIRKYCIRNRPKKATLVDVPSAYKLKKAKGKATSKRKWSVNESEKDTPAEKDMHAR